MAAQPLDPHPTADRRPAVWPWLLIPLIALTLFFALQKVKTLPPAEPLPHTESVDGSAAAEAESP